MRDLIIIGGGAAGQAAALYAIGKQIDFLLIYEEFGGRAGQVIPIDRDYLVGSILVHFETPDPEDDEQQLIGSSAVHLFERQLRRHVGCVLHDSVQQVVHSGDGFEVVTRRHGVHNSRTLIIATGATPRHLDLSDQTAPPVQDLGYILTTRAEQVAGRQVAVIGASERALYGAAELATRAQCVHLLAPERLAGESPIITALRQHPGVALQEGVSVSRVFANNGMSSLQLTGAGGNTVLDVDNVFADLGLLPHSELVRHLGVTDADGFIQVDGHNATIVPGLFAAGDVIAPLGEQLLIAIGDGARAAVGAHQYLLERPLVRHHGG